MQTTNMTMCIPIGLRTRSSVTQSKQVFDVLKISWNFCRVLRKFPLDIFQGFPKNLVLFARDRFLSPSSLSFAACLANSSSFSLISLIEASRSASRRCLYSSSRLNLSSFPSFSRLNLSSFSISSRLSLSSLFSSLTLAHSLSSLSVAISISRTSSSVKSC
jgi:hypothetical protein